TVVITAGCVGDWLDRAGVRTLFIEPGSPWKNGFIESLNGNLRNKLLNAERLDTLPEARVLTERCRRHYNVVHPHSSLNDRPPAAETVLSAINFTPDPNWNLAPSAGEGHFRCQEHSADRVRAVGDRNHQSSSPAPVNALLVCLLTSSG
ncbi:MAG: transposase, partial [Fuerstiella sp.]|nr:transposase [Fuerstiella sp.]